MEALKRALNIFRHLDSDSDSESECDFSMNYASAEGEDMEVPSDHPSTEATPFGSATSSPTRSHDGTPPPQARAESPTPGCSYTMNQNSDEEGLEQDGSGVVLRPRPVVAPPPPKVGSPRGQKRRRPPVKRQSKTADA